MGEGVAAGAAGGSALGPWGALGGAALGGIGDYRGQKRQGEGLDRAMEFMQNPSYSEYGQKTQEQIDLENMSRQQYLAQQGLVSDMQSQLAGRQELAQNAQGTVGDIMGGSAFALTPDEQQRIDAMRQADIAASQNAVQGLLDQNFASLNADMARRGVRGQAASQLQGSTLNTAADQLNRATLEANRNAGQMALQMPGQRVGIQANTAGQFANFGDALQQRAFNNMQTLQNPTLMNQYQNERIGTARNYGQNNQAIGNMMVQRSQIDPEMGFISGMMGGASGGVGAAQGMRSLMG
jgi:hypothetical protein